MRIYFAEETKKAQKNFPFGDDIINYEFIHCLGEVKLASATANYKLGNLGRDKYFAISFAIGETIRGKFDRQFVTTNVQGGAGTSINMNMNEVVASRASEVNKKIKIHYLDDVNKSQSTNDVIPTALRLFCLKNLDKYENELNKLRKSLLTLTKKYKNVKKVGRTHLQDAVEISFGQVFGAYISLIDRDKKRLSDVKKYLLITNLGGTAIGTKVNSSQKYVDIVNKELARITKYKFKPGNLVDQTQNLDTFLFVMKLLEISAIGISKVCSDIRLLASGPRAGFGELVLPEAQKGSTIMPGKNNPVIFETINQICMKVIGNSNSASIATLSGQLELNVMLPIFIASISESLNLLIKGAAKLSESVVSIKVNEKRCKELIKNSFCLMTEKTSEFGYDKVEILVKEALNSRL